MHDHCYNLPIFHQHGTQPFIIQKVRLNFPFTQCKQFGKQKSHSSYINGHLAFIRFKRNKKKIQAPENIHIFTSQIHLLVFFDVTSICITETTGKNQRFVQHTVTVYRAYRFTVGFV